MKLLNINKSALFFGVLILNSCSDKPPGAYAERDFRGRVFISESYGGGKSAKLYFGENDNTLTATDIPFNTNFTKQYEILRGEISPSGSPTISVESWHYFIISDRNKLTYRYYEGMAEKTIVFREVEK